ncbi:hypothetical protein [Limnoglobus roseus]|uniref:Uncharacterized protein n=1 Tax=Limnoglobus roseus TaxID=2598579 RepID=A0A5C1ACL5_9BACT|nr:hypothetical protein [Limnoglobus roseus]QEL17139.1 hypothetical protein PX52LOC_04120 [Limnoglobus roseus]
MMSDEAWKAKQAAESEALPPEGWERLTHGLSGVFKGATPKETEKITRRIKWLRKKLDYWFPEARDWEREFVNGLLEQIFQPSEAEGVVNDVTLEVYLTRKDRGNTPLSAHLNTVFGKVRSRARDQLARERRESRSQRGLSAVANEEDYTHRRRMANPLWFWEFFPDHRGTPMMFDAWGLTREDKGFLRLIAEEGYDRLEAAEAVKLKGFEIATDRQDATALATAEDRVRKRLSRLQVRIKKCLLADAKDSDSDEIANWGKGNPPRPESRIPKKLSSAVYQRQLPMRDRVKRGKVLTTRARRAARKKVLRLKRRSEPLIPELTIALAVALDPAFDLKAVPKELPRLPRPVPRSASTANLCH